MTVTDGWVVIFLQLREVWVGSFLTEAPHSLYQMLLSNQHWSFCQLLLQHLFALFEDFSTPYMHVASLISLVSLVTSSYLVS